MRNLKSIPFIEVFWKQRLRRTMEPQCYNSAQSCLKEIKIQLFQSLFGEQLCRVTTVKLKKTCSDWKLPSRKYLYRQISIIPKPDCNSQTWTKVILEEIPLLFTTIWGNHFAFAIVCWETFIEITQANWQSGTILTNQSLQWLQAMLRPGGGG